MLVFPVVDARDFNFVATDRLVTLVLTRGRIAAGFPLIVAWSISVVSFL